MSRLEDILDYEGEFLVKKKGNPLFVLLKLFFLSFWIGAGSRYFRPVLNISGIHLDAIISILIFCAILLYFLFRFYKGSDNFIQNRFSFDVFFQLENSTLFLGFFIGWTTLNDGFKGLWMPFVESIILIWFLTSLVGWVIIQIIKKNHEKKEVDSR